jgi:hypothetical protein
MKIIWNKSINMLDFDLNATTSDLRVKHLISGTDK